MNIYIEQITQEGPQLETVKKLFAEYQKELDENLCFQSFDKELSNPLVKYGAPKGALYIARIDEKLIGCVALQSLADGSCEMKRLYVQPSYRKYGVGKLLVHTILQKATEIGYIKMKLDTLTKLVPAIKLYETFGFVHTNSYYENPLDNVVYMEKELQ
jgi:putative acetyltransferase